MKIKKQKFGGTAVFLAVCGTVCFLLYSSVLPFFVKDGSVLPDLMLCLCCGAASIYDEKTCCVFAIILGFAADLLVNQPFCFSPVIYLTAVLCVLRFGNLFKRRGTLNTAVCGVPALLLRETVLTLHTLGISESVKAADVITDSMLPSLAVNFAFAMVVTFCVRRLNAFFRIQK